MSVTFDPPFTQIRFSPIQESDLERINELANMPDIADHFETIPPVSMETTRALWNYIQSGLVFLWGISEGEQIIGGAGFYAQPPGMRLSHIATFFLYLDPSYWGRGIGKSAIRFLEDEIKTRGYHKMECMVVDTNPRAISLYKRMGYLEEGRKREAFLIEGHYKDLLLMGKIL